MEHDSAGHSGKRSNIQEIALKCGIHPSTVSSVLTGKTKQRRISAQLAEQVLRTAAELDYSPNLLMHSIRSGRTNNVAFYNGLREHRRSDVYIDTLKVAIERSAGTLGYDVTVSCDFNRSVPDTYKNLNGGRSDGLVLFKPHLEDPLLDLLRKSRMPVLLINTVDDKEILSSISEDIVMGVRLVADSLIRCGHRRVAIVAASHYVVDSIVRVNLLRNFMAEYGVTIPDEWVIHNDERSIASLLNGPAPPTAVFCWHDQLAYAVLDTCETLGIDVPTQLSVIGYDGLKWPSKSDKYLTTIEVDLDELGETAVKTLDAMISGNVELPVVRRLPVKFVPGATLSTIN